MYKWDFASELSNRENFKLRVHCIAKSLSTYTDITGSGHTQLYNFN